MRSSLTNRGELKRSTNPLESVWRAGYSMSSTSIFASNGSFCARLWRVAHAYSVGLNSQSFLWNFEARSCQFLQNQNPSYRKMNQNRIRIVESLLDTHRSFPSLQSLLAQPLFLP